jgi:phosphoribosyl 1,2-cyclic phosphodiesterase
MQVRFWGVRGSIASSGSRLQDVGGNTSCVEVRAGTQTLILDAGTGLRELGLALQRDGRAGRLTMLVSHFHWDHIQGFPFFGPAYAPGNEIQIFGAPEPGAGALRDAFAAQMRPPHFPVGLEAMRAELRFRELRPGGEFAVGDVLVRTAAARHPNDCVAYRVEHEGASVVYATDTEHDADSGRLDQNLLALARGADLLIYDAQYTPEEYAAGKRGWGHSTAEEGVRLAEAAGCARLALFHHDPAHDDGAVAHIEARARARFAGACAAREGMVVDLGGSERKAA